MAEEIFLDKISLGGSIVQKELKLIQQYNELIKDINNQQLTSDDLKNWQAYSWVWQNIAELYNFLKNDYIGKLPKEEGENLENVIVKKWQRGSIHPSLTELHDVYNLILKLMSLSKFHDLVRKSEEDLNIEESFT